MEDITHVSVFISVVEVFTWGENAANPVENNGVICFIWRWVPVVLPVPLVLTYIDIYFLMDTSLYIFAVLIIKEWNDRVFITRSPIIANYKEIN